jgi:DNA replication initiation complex subunit (GINS family)
MNLSELLKLWRVEKGSSVLAKLPPQFYSETRELFEGKSNYEAEKAKGIYDDIVAMRQHKMLMGCLRQMRGGEKQESLLAVEKEVYNSVYNQLIAMKEGRVEAVEMPPTVAPAEEAQETLADLEVEVSVDEEKGRGLEEAAPALAAPAEAPHHRKKDGDVFKGEAENKALKRVRFLRPMPAFIGPDLQTLGPFDEDQVSELDGEIAEILIKNDAVELM